MSVSILLICHREIGSAFVHTAQNTYGGKLPLPISTVEVQPDTDPDTLIPELKRLAKELDQGDGVLVLTDLFGATPCNIARALMDIGHIHLVAGLNLPMLLQVMNYPDRSLDELAKTAMEAGHGGIVSE